MAKRRNLKKEKEERNKAYARKFRKTSSGRFSRGGGKRYTKKSEEQDDNKSVEETN